MKSSNYWLDPLTPALSLVGEGVNGTAVTRCVDFVKECPLRMFRDCIVALDPLYTLLSMSRLLLGSADLYNDAYHRELANQRGE
jgi:hypothetical protein